MQSPQRASRRPLAPNLAKVIPAKPDCQPAAIPLPPSPPASDALNLELPPTRPSRTTRPKPNLAIFAPDASSEPSPSVVPTTHAKRRRPAEDPFDSSSPPTSPTTRKSLPPKRLKTAPRQSRVEPDLRDSPNNPFLVQPGEKSRRAGSKCDDAQRQLVYVFRGKRIPYDTTEDLDHSGGSPFALSGPKLLFPSPPTPPPQPALELDEDEPVASGSDARRLAFETPKRDRTRNNPGPEMLPTPQSRPRKTDGKVNSRIPVGPVTNKASSSKTLARAMMR